MFPGIHPTRPPVLSFCFYFYLENEIGTYLTQEYILIFEKAMSIDRTRTYVNIFMNDKKTKHFISISANCRFVVSYYLKW